MKLQRVQNDNEGGRSIYINSSRKTLIHSYGGMHPMSKRRRRLQ
jgi:hypothetical protein